MSDRQYSFKILTDGDRARLKRFDRPETRKWKDLFDLNGILTGFEPSAYWMIKRLLGYLPNEAFLKEHLPGIKAAIKLIKGNTWNKEHGFDELVKHVKALRNSEMVHLESIFASNSEKMCAAYTESELPYGQIGRTRITRFLGYEPQLEHSLYGELLLRNYLGLGALTENDEITEYDFEVLTIILHRQTLLSEGSEAAYDYPPIGCLYRKI